MKYANTLSLALCVLLLLLTLVSCMREPKELGGVPVTPEMLASVSRSLDEAKESETTSKKTNKTQASEETQAQTVHTTSSEVNQSSVADTTANSEASSVVTVVTALEEVGIPETVYWTESGKVYHWKETCGSLRHSEHVLSGSVDEALAAKKERACKSCS